MTWGIASENRAFRKFHETGAEAARYCRNRGVRCRGTTPAHPQLARIWTVERLTMSDSAGAAMHAEGPNRNGQCGTEAT